MSGPARPPRRSGGALGRVELTLGTGIAAGGDGIGRLPDGRVVFVEGGLPGERVAVELTESRRDYAKGHQAAVIEASPDRVAPPCRWVDRGCGGCGWQHARPETQVSMKERVVLDALRRIAHLDASDLLGPSAALPFQGYRTSVHLAVDGQGRPAYRVRHRHDLVAVSGCLVAHPRLAELIDRVRAPGAGRVTMRVGVAGGERLVLADSPTRDAVSAPPDVRVAGAGEPAVFHEEVGGRRWRVSARSFFQSGPAGAEALAGLVDEAVGPMAPGERLVDLYAGVGVLGGVVAARRSGVELTAVESDGSATGDAKANLADLGATVVAGQVGGWAATPATVVIADPARPGLGRPGVAATLATGCRRLVLVSCDPASLARDASLLAAGGAHLENLRLVDLFPHTPHVETVAVFDFA